MRGLGRSLKLVGRLGFVIVFILGSLSLAATLNSSSNYQEETPETSSEVNALVVLGSSDSRSMDQTINLIESMGGRIVYIYPTHVLIGYIPEDLESSVSELDGVIELYRGPVDLSVVEGYGDLALGGVMAWNNKLEGKPSLLDLRPEPVSLLDNSTDNSATQGTVTAAYSSPGTVEYAPPYLMNSRGTNVTGVAGADSYSHPYNGGAWGTAEAWTGVGMGYGSHVIFFTAVRDGEVTIEVELLYAGGVSKILAAMAGIGYYSLINGEQYQEVALALSLPGFPTDLIGLLESLVEFALDSWELRESLQAYVESGDAKTKTWSRTFDVTADETYVIEAGIFAKASGALLGYAEAAIIGQEWRIRVMGAPVRLLRSGIISAPSEVHQGETFQTTWSVRNNSSVPVNNVSVQSYVYYGSIVYNVCGWDSNLTSIDLAPGETKELTQNIKIRTDLSPSDYTWLRVRARYADVDYAETWPIRVLPSSLVSRVVEAPDKVSLGETFTIRWKVSNDYPSMVENVRVHSYVYLYKYQTDETICYNVGGWGANEQYIDLEPGENRELVQTITIRSDVEPSTETRLRVRAVVPPQKVNEGLEEGEPIYETVAFYDTRSINVVPPPGSGVVWIFPSDDATVTESYPDSPETRTDRVGIRSWDASVGDIEDYRNIRSLLKFDLSEIPTGSTILDAELRLYCYYAGYTITGVTDVQVWSTRDDWMEDTVTWDDQPWQLGDVLDVWVPPEYVDKYGWPKVWASWTVADFVSNELETDKDKMASFCLRAATESYDSQWRNVYFRSKDYTYGATKIGGYDPHLVVTYVPPQ